MQKTCLTSSGFLLATMFTSNLLADVELQTDDEQAPHLETVTIVASPPERYGQPGATTVIDNAQLEQFAYADIQRALREMPGIALQVEDGFGLRPNISIRGVASERSARITMLEDNVLIAPAPYSAPSAYYFPTPGRMHSIEVLKGPSAISQGPYTIGGALNLVSTPILNETKGQLVTHAGEYGSNRIHAWHNFSNDAGFSGLIETHQWRSDGYQSIDRSNRGTGLDVRDYTAKVRMEPASNQWLEFKYQLADQVSDQSYLGLTDVDFNADSMRRYGISALDQIETSHQQGILTYAVDFSESTKLRIKAYRNNHERTWFKTEGIDFDGSDQAETLSRASWSSVVQAVNLKQDIGSVSWQDLNAILQGTMDTAPGSIQLRANAREYFSQGLQVSLEHTVELSEVTHNLHFNVRSHADEEDRLQRNSSFHQENGQMILDDLGLLGNAGNRIQEAQALSFYVKDVIEMGRLTLTPGLRFEDIDQQRTRYEIRHGRTDNPASRSSSNLRSTRENLTKVWSPGIGAAYKTNANTVLHVGAYKGFTAPSNAPGVNEESALIFEGGLRYESEDSPFTADIVLFLTDYDNLLGECTASSGADCEIGDSFNGDAATVRGLEAQFSTDLAQNSEFSIPISLSATFFNGQFDTNIADTDFFGEVDKGDPIPYLPDTQFHLKVGFVKQPFEGFLSLNRTGEVCTRASCSAYEKVDGALTVDASANYSISDPFTLFGRIENLFSEDAIASRHPYGARPYKPRTMILGLNFNW